MGVQAHVAFRRVFELTAKPHHALVHVFADSRYLLWVNGHQIMRGPCRFHPKRPEYDSLDMAPWLQSGTNTIVALVHHYPVTHGRMMRHAPGFTLLLQEEGREVLRTDGGWRCSARTEYLDSPGAWSSIPDVIDQRKSPGEWQGNSFDDSGWPAAVAVDGGTWGAFHARSIPLPRETVIKQVGTVPTGTPLRVPFELHGTHDRAWQDRDGFQGAWMWTPRSPQGVAWKAVWSIAGYGAGSGSQLRVCCDDPFTVFQNGREIARVTRRESSWTGTIDPHDGDAFAIRSDAASGTGHVGLFVSMMHSGHCLLDTARFTACSGPPPPGWMTNGECAGFHPLTADAPASGGDLTNPSVPSVTLDLGRMSMVHPVLVVDAEEGSVLRLEYSLRCRNGRPEETYGAGSTYVTKQGVQTFTGFDSWCARYVTLRCLSGRVTIQEAGFIERCYPFDRVGRFSSGDAVLDPLWLMAARTIECTSDDAYGSDARERNEWVQDSLLASYATSRVMHVTADPSGKRIGSDPGLLRNTLRHAALSQTEEGDFPGTFPTDRGREDCHYVIEDYSCLWVEGLRTYYEATGDLEFVREMWPHLLRQMHRFLACRTSRGLLSGREYASFDNPLAYVPGEGTTLNGYFYRALKDSVSLARALRESRAAAEFQAAADALRVACNRDLWCPQEDAVGAGIIGGALRGPTVHAQMLALHAGILDAPHEASATRWFLQHYRNPGGWHCGSNPDWQSMIERKCGLNMPIMYHGALSLLYSLDTSDADREALEEIRRRWGPIVRHFQDAGTLPESFVDDAGNGASESCHNYGAVPAYFLGAYVLGVRRVDPVWERSLVIEPRLGDLQRVQGVVATEFGPVPVAWQRMPDRLTFDVVIPEGITAVMRIADGADSGLQLDGNPSSSRSRGRYAEFTLSGGVHHGWIPTRSPAPSPMKN